MLSMFLKSILLELCKCRFFFKKKQISSLICWSLFGKFSFEMRERKIVRTFWEMIEIYKIKLVGIKKAFCMQITHRRRSLYELCCTFFYTNHVGCCRALPAKKYHFCMHGLIQNEFAFDSA